MIDEARLDPSAAEAGEAGGVTDREPHQFGMPGVDDLGSDLDRRLGLPARRGGGADQRQQRTDPHHLGRARAGAGSDRWSSQQQCAAADHGDLPTFAKSAGPRRTYPQGRHGRIRAIRAARTA